jgi:hypothetical protein
MTHVFLSLSRKHKWSLSCILIDRRVSAFIGGLIVVLGVLGGSIIGLPLCPSCPL